MEALLFFAKMATSFLKRLQPSRTTRRRVGLAVKFSSALKYLKHVPSHFIRVLSVNTRLARSIFVAYLFYLIKNLKAKLNPATSSEKLITITIIFKRSDNG